MKSHAAAGKTRKPNTRPVPDDVEAALGVLVARLAPIDKSEEKLMVLGKLAETLPVPVARVLHAVIDDLRRLSGER